MNLRVRIALLSSIGALAGCGGRTTGANGEGDTVFVRAVQQLEQPDCVAKADPTATFLDRGSLDAALSPRYRAWFLVGNRAPNDAAHYDSGTIAEISGAEVQLFDLGLSTHDLVATYSLDAVGSADGAAAYGEPGYGLAAVEILPPSVVAPIGAKFRDEDAPGAVRSYEAHVALTGSFVGGETFRTAEYVFVVDVCYGCSVTFPLDAVDPTVLPYPNCLREGDVVPFANQACLPGQDGQTDCRSCIGLPVCTLCRFDENCPPGSRCGDNGVCR
jgi:hypothetical protein